MNPISLTCILVGVALNAGAQLLLKAGVRAVGHFEFTTANIVPVGLKIAMQWPIIGGLACYVISVGVWIVGSALGRFCEFRRQPVTSVRCCGHSIRCAFTFQFS